MSNKNKSELVPCKKQDFLDNDPPIRGQNYYCISFLSPEDVIKKKEGYFFETYIKNFSLEMNEFFNRLTEKYQDEKDTFIQLKDRFHFIFDRDGINDNYINYYNLHSEELEKAYYEANGFQTSIRGVKVRGVFDSFAGAENRCKVLKSIDSNFNVFVAEIGAWCPWSPNPDDIEDQVHSETQLNTLNKHYKDNVEMRNQFYEERKRELLHLANEKKNNNSANTSSNLENNNNSNISGNNNNSTNTSSILENNNPADTSNNLENNSNISGNNNNSANTSNNLVNNSNNNPADTSSNLENISSCNTQINNSTSIQEMIESPDTWPKK